MSVFNLQENAITLLKSLIQTPSFSGEEDRTAQLLEKWFRTNNIKYNRCNNNLWAFNNYFDDTKPTILLNSHHDTVKPNKNYTKNPFEPEVIDGKLFGLGSNDAGGCLVSLLALFKYFYNKKNLKYNLVIATTAEEENSGPNGLNSILKNLPEIEFAIVGEPTLMELAVAEKGLLVIDACSKGKSGHAAHYNTENAISIALNDINWIHSYQFDKTSENLGGIKMTVTQINAGKQHNVVPGECQFVIDVRVNECYSNHEVFDIINNNTASELKARSFNLNSSSIAVNHDIVKAGLAFGRNTYGSPTLSDQAVLNCPSLKLGPGDSLRSHSADEFIYLNEIKDGIKLYIDIIKAII